MSVLIGVLLVLVAAMGTGVVLSRDPRHQVLAIGANGFVLALLFLVLQAPDVAYAEIVVGAAITPLLFLVTLASMRIKHNIADKEEEA